MEKRIQYMIYPEGLNKLEIFIVILTGLEDHSFPESDWKYLISTLKNNTQLGELSKAFRN